MKFSIKESFSKCDQRRKKLKKSLMENFIFCAVYMEKSTLNRLKVTVFTLPWF